MKTIHFSIQINAPREKVWDLMLSDKTYREWASVFNPGSYFEGSWEQGSKIRFIGPDEDGKTTSGMMSRVKESRKPEFVSLEHYGIIMKGVEDTTSEQTKKWTPAFENYTFNEKDGGTELIIDVDTSEEYEEMFSEMWPKALQLLKGICER